MSLIRRWSSMMKVIGDDGWLTAEAHQPGCPWNPLQSTDADLFQVHVGKQVSRKIGPHFRRTRIHRLDPGGWIEDLNSSDLRHEATCPSCRGSCESHTRLILQKNAAPHTHNPVRSFPQHNILKHIMSIGNYFGHIDLSKSADPYQYHSLDFRSITYRARFSSDRRQ